jgi:hypothetical protein
MLLARVLPVPFSINVPAGVLSSLEKIAAGREHVTVCGEVRRYVDRCAARYRSRRLK